jgi:hypothetical protein
MKRLTVPPMSPKNKKRSTVAAVVLSVLAGLSQVPWVEVLAFVNRLLGGE